MPPFEKNKVPPSPRSDPVNAHKTSQMADEEVGRMKSEANAATRRRMAAKKTIFEVERCFSDAKKKKEKNEKNEQNEKMKKK